MFTFHSNNYIENRLERELTGKVGELSSIRKKFDSDLLREQAQFSKPEERETQWLLDGYEALLVSQQPNVTAVMAYKWKRLLLYMCFLMLTCYFQTKKK